MRALTLYGLPGPLHSTEGGSSQAAWLQRATKTLGRPAEVTLLETQLPEPALPQAGLCSSQAHKLWAGQGTGRHWKSKAKRRNASTFSWHDAGTSWPNWHVLLGTCICGRQHSRAHLGVLEDVHDEYGQAQPKDVGHKAGVEIRVRVLLQAVEKGSRAQ